MGSLIRLVAAVGMVVAIAALVASATRADDGYLVGALVVLLVHGG